MSIEHYENFPVASVLCPAPLRAPISAIYRFARTADDIADEGSASTAERLADLHAFRADLAAVCAGAVASPRWPQVFLPLAASIAAFNLPPRLLHDLLDAFVQDTGNPVYPDRSSLLDYCSRSANPIGRLLLHLYGIADAQAVRQSDAVCSALQLINFWQDISVDGPRGRHYVPLDDLHRHGLTVQDLAHGRDSKAARAMVRELCLWARELMLQGAPLALRVPGRAGWELRLVVQGGLRILEKISRMDHAALSGRPALKPLDVAFMLWASVRMPARLSLAATGPAVP